MKRLHPRVYVSSLSLVPRGARTTASIVADAGLSGIQLTPLWWWAVPQIRRYFAPRQIVAIDSPCWDETESVPARIVRSVRDRDCGIVQTTPVFGWGAWQRSRRYAEAFPNALTIGFGAEPVLETSLINSTRACDYYDHPHGVVFDTYHVLECRTGYGCLWSDPLELLEYLRIHGQIKLVHLQFRDHGEIDDFYHGIGLAHPVLQRVALQSIRIPIVLELHPKLLWRDPVGTLARLREQICSYYDK